MLYYTPIYLQRMATNKVLKNANNYVKSVLLVTSAKLTKRIVSSSDLRLNKKKYDMYYTHNIQMDLLFCNLDSEKV